MEEKTEISSNTHLDAFLHLFPESLFVFFEDEDGRPKDLPVLHKRSSDSTNLKWLNNQGYGCFISVNGFQEGIKRDETSLSVLQHLFCDIDAPKPPKGQICLSEKARKAFKNEALKLIHDVDTILPLSFLVETKNGFHAYWRLAPPVYRPSEADKQLYRDCLDDLRSRLKGDDGAKDLARVLRIPGTLHQKQPNDPFLTKLVLFRPDIAYVLQDLAPKLLKDQKATEAILVSSGGLPMEDSVDPASSSPVPEDEESLVFTLANVRRDDIPKDVKDAAFMAALQDLNQSYPKHERPSFTALANPHSVSVGERNKSLLIVASILRESAGATEDEVLARFPAYNGLSQREIRSVVRHAFQRAEPYRFGWSDPVYARAITPEEAHRVRTVTSESVKLRYRAYRAELERDAGEQTGVAQDPRERAKEQALAPVNQGALAKAVQKELFKDFETTHFIKLYPFLRLIDQTYFLDFDEQNGWAPVSMNEIESRFFRLLRDAGLDEMRTVTNVLTKRKCLMSLPSVQMSGTEVNSCELLTKKTGSNGPFVPLKNGIYDLERETLLPHDPSAVLLSRIRAPFVDSENLNQYAIEIVDRFLNQISGGDQIKRAVLEEIMGYCLLPDNRLQKAFILVGDGANGKSTFLKALTEMLGPQSVLGFRTEELNNNFFLSQTFGKRLGMVEEVSGNYFESDIFKKLVSGETVSADVKYQTALTFRPSMKIVFAVNQLPKINDSSPGLYRRLILIPMTATFSGAALDPDLPAKLETTEAQSYLLWLSLRAAKRLLKRKAFSANEFSGLSVDDYLEQNSSAVEFMKSEYTILPLSASNDMIESEAIPFTPFMQAYFNFCTQNGYQSKSGARFRAELKHTPKSIVPHFALKQTPHGWFVYGLKTKRSILPR